MSLKKNIIQIWKNKDLILEGITNSIFKKEDVEEIAKWRLEICSTCPLFTHSDAGCMVPKTGPCCDMTKGGCGCSLGFKTRSLSSECPHPDGPKWKSEMNEYEEDLLNEKLGL